MRTFYGIYCISNLDAGLRGKTANVVYNDHLQYNNWVSHYSDIIVGTKRLKSPASWLFTEPFIETQIKEKIKATRHWLCEGNGPVTSEFPAQMTSNSENVSIWWRHQE